MSKMLTAKEIREQLNRYLAGDVDPATFRDWFAVVLRDVHTSIDPQAEELAHSIEWAFSDLDRGAAPEQVRDNLAALAASRFVVLVQCGEAVQIPGNFFHGMVSTATLSIPEIPASAVGTLVGVGRAVEYAS